MDRSEIREDAARALAERGIVKITPTRNAVIVEIVPGVERPIVHIECKDETARPDLEQLARRILFQIALRP